MTQDKYHVPRPCARCKKDMGDFGTLYACNHEGCSMRGVDVCVKCTVPSNVKKHVVEYRESWWERAPKWPFHLLAWIVVAFVSLLVLEWMGLGWYLWLRVVIAFALFIVLALTDTLWIGWGWGMGAGPLGGTDSDISDLILPPDNTQTPESPYSRATLRCCRACGYETRVLK